jgi:hypothetical protein
MGLDPASVNLLAYGAAAGLGENDLTKIEIIGEELRRVEFRPQLPREELKAAFPGLNIYGAKKACCGCLIPLLSTLKAIGQSDKACNIYIGEKPTRADENGLTIGECAGAGNPKIISVTGCPPDRDEIRRALGAIFQSNE